MTLNGTCYDSRCDSDDGSTIMRKYMCLARHRKEVYLEKDNVTLSSSFEPTALDFNNMHNNFYNRNKGYF